jgi:hypothetical protein
MATRAAATFLNRNSSGWIEELEDPNPVVRRLACRALEMIWCTVEDGRGSVGEAFPIRVWGQDNAGHRARSARKGPLETLFGRLQNAGSLSADRVARHLAGLTPEVLGRRLLLAKLRPLLSDPDPAVRQEAASTIRMLTGQARVSENDVDTGEDAS